MIRSILLGSCLALAAVGVASAQTPWVEIDDQIVVAPFALSADAIDDMDIVDAAGKKIGEVEDVVGPNRNEATAVVIDLDTMSGLIDGDKDIVVPLAGVHGKALRLLGDAATIRGYQIYQD